METYKNTHRGTLVVHLKDSLEGYFTMFDNFYGYFKQANPASYSKNLYFYCRKYRLFKNQLIMSFRKRYI